MTRVFQILCYHHYRYQRIVITTITTTTIINCRQYCIIDKTIYYQNYILYVCGAADIRIICYLTLQV